MSAEGPRRLLDYGDDLNGLLRGALEAERTDAVDGDRLERIAQAMAIAGTTAPPPSPGANTAAAPNSAASMNAANATKPTTGWLASKGPVVVLAVAIASGFAFLRSSDVATPTAPAPQTTGAARQRAPEPMTVVAPSPAEPKTTAITTPTISPADLPSVPAAAPPAPSAPSRRLAKTESGAEADEIALLARAHDALHGDPRTSLALCREHETRFAGGQFAQEREAVGIEALVYLGRNDEARRRWNDFQRRYPSSSHRVHLESLFAAPPPP